MDLCQLLLIVIYSEKGSDGTNAGRNTALASIDSQQQLVIRTQGDQVSWEAEASRMRVQTASHEHDTDLWSGAGLCVHRDCSDYFPSDGEPARGSAVRTHGPEPIDSCWLDFDAPSVFGRLLSHFPLRPASTNLRACLLNPNAR